MQSNKVEIPELHNKILKEMVLLITSIRFNETVHVNVLRCYTVAFITANRKNISRVEELRIVTYHPTILKYMNPAEGEPPSSAQLDDCGKMKM